jgi:hypothetical protein
MKSNFIFAAILIFIGISFINGCHKEPIVENDPNVIKESFTQEFTFPMDTLSKHGWSIKDQSNPHLGGWVRGGYSDKINSGPDLYPSYSGGQGEFAYSGHYNATAVNSWLITPPVMMKNGDKISFYTKGDALGINVLEVRLNLSDTTSFTGSNPDDVGKFTTLIGSINSSSVANGYPVNWVRYDYILTSLPAPVTSRIALRCAVANPNGQGAIAIDLLHFEKQ